jgi:hypothetical protein
MKASELLLDALREAAGIGAACQAEGKDWQEDLRLHALHAQLCATLEESLTVGVQEAAGGEAPPSSPESVVYGVLSAWWTKVRAMPWKQALDQSETRGRLFHDLAGKIVAALDLQVATGQSQTVSPDG